MNDKNKKIDRSFLASVIILLVSGVLVFVSASLGTLAQSESKFYSILFNHLFFGLLLGSIACYIFSKINYKLWKNYAFIIFLFTLIFTAMVFIPGVGQKLNGATRWINIAGITIQPVEFLKIGFLIYWSAWLSFAKDKVRIFKYAFFPYAIIMAIIGIILLKQPDTDSFIVIAIAGFAMLMVSGARKRHLAIIGICGLIVASIYFSTRPYILDRIKTFFVPSANPQTSGWQIQQSLIAIGSGEIAGRGFGQSLQKFKFLPESISDSIYAVACEEFGFVGGISIVIMFIFFISRGLRVAKFAQDNFGGLLTTGIVILIGTQSFMNIASMIGAMPLSGLPLIFFSHGGTAMLATLASVGIVFNISRFKKIN